MRVRSVLAFWVATTLTGGLWAHTANLASEMTRYTIGTVSEGLAHVRIEHTLAGNMLHLPTRTAEGGVTVESFLSKVTLTNDAGTSELEFLGNGAWSTGEAGAGDRVVIDYDLRLDHGNHKWEHGREEIGFALGDGAFLITRATMLADYNAHGPVEVEFKAKDSAAPWTSIGENLWRAESMSAFLNNGFAFGDGFGRFTAETAEGTVTFIHDGASLDLAQQAAKDIAPALAHTTAIFGDFPISNYHIFMFENDHPEGGAYDDSFAMLHPVPAQRVDALLWRQGFIHEINHLWVGHQIRPAAGADIEWFKEGVADYLAIKTMWKLNYIDDQGLAKKLENLMRRHTLGVYMTRGAIGLTEAGANKSQNQMIIYGSGATWAFMLDVEMSATQGLGSFEALLKDLYEHSAEPYTQERLMTRLNASSDGAAGRLLAKFERNLMPMAFPAMLEPYGMEIAFMIPDMFELDLNPQQCDGPKCLPAFLRDAE